MFLEEGAGDFAGFGEGGAGDEDEAELGSGGHVVSGKIVADFWILGGVRKRDLTQSTQREEHRGHGEVTQEHRQECLCHKRPQEGRASPAPTRIGGVTVECGDYGYYTGGVAD